MRFEPSIHHVLCRRCLATWKPSSKTVRKLADRPVRVDQEREIPKDTPSTRELTNGDSFRLSKPVQDQGVVLVCRGVSNLT